MEIKKEFRNDLLKRKEIELVGEYGANPGFEAAKKDAAKLLKEDESKIVIRNVKNKFGSRNFVIDLFVYDSVEDLSRIEPKKKEKKKK